jgi:hypothetical protein
MRAIKLLVLSALTVVAISCSDEETNVEKYYEGIWEIKSTSTEIDSISRVYVSGSGNFEYELNYGSAVEQIVGRVEEDGELRADIRVDTLILGNSLGQLNPEGTGSGEYTIVNQKFSWTATKQ